ncbi:hypothetical protein VTJ49DRAFT_2116 [Mycothermus thermophilus]|uniref:Ubiquitin 3 binding protein But2 C-terminal domain-containing protein n=1 Tax=Humicola insolens TaxID=85995 RepID=A0ABR3VCF3_HUMIN
MHFSILLALTTLASALPTPSLSSAKNQCRDDNQTPTCKHISPPTSQTPRLYIVNRPDLSYTTTQTVTFTLPSDASGSSCTLQARFPPQWEIVDTSVLKGGSPLPVNVYAVDSAQEGKEELLATVALASENPEENAPSSPEGREDRVVVVVSEFECREEVSFKFELAGEGEVGFVNGFDEGLRVSGGLEVVYGC